MVAGLTRFVNKGHIARAVLEAVAFQSRTTWSEAMNRDSGVELHSLKVDGGMVVNDLLMQFQSDILNVPVIRPKVTETTALGAAYAAGLAVGFWSDMEELRQNWSVDKTWQPGMSAATVKKRIKAGKKPWIEPSTGSIESGEPVNGSYGSILRFTLNPAGGDLTLRPIHH